MFVQCDIAATATITTTIEGTYLGACPLSTTTTNLQGTTPHYDRHPAAAG